MNLLRSAGSRLPLLAAAAAAGRAAEPILGFSPAASAEQARIEGVFDAGLHPADLRTWLQAMSSEPNNVGTAKDKANAEFMAAQFRAWGWDSRLEIFYCLYPTPVRHSLDLVAPTRYSVRLKERPLPGDSTSRLVDRALPAYTIYGADGDVTGELVYVNYGMPADYEELARHGVSVKGRLVLARYGVAWRGLKPKLAHEHGAIGCIIYSDPRDGGYFRGETYPAGSWAAPESIQRGSVMDLPVYPGDPLTPGVGATKDAKRLSIAEATTILKIPVIPIAAEEAQPLLAALRGPMAPEAWRGALPVTYHLGPGPARVHLQIASDWSLKPVYDVVAVLRGSEQPDQWVVRGNHHDGWTFGAYDPLSANVSMMAEAQSIGQLVKTGWRPKRTLVYCGWDGEEPGLLGSTEWGEEHAAELQAKAVLYVNSDCYGRGPLETLGSQQLTACVAQIQEALPDPETGVSMAERRRDMKLVAAYQTGGTLPPSGGPPEMPAAGGGSDFTVFLAHLGIASLDTHPGGEFHSAGIYHTAYDSFDYYVRFVDTDFSYGIAAARGAGRMVLRMADAEVLPLRFGDLARAVQRYLDEARRIYETTKTRVRESNELVSRNAFAVAADPREAYVPPAAESPVEPLDFAPLGAAVARLKASAEDYDRRYAAALAQGLPLSPEQKVRLNQTLQGMDQTLLDPAGLPGRPWHKHLLYAPGRLTGYDVKTLPEVTEGVEGKAWAEAREGIAHTAAGLGRFCDRLDTAAALLSPDGPAPRP